MPQSRRGPEAQRPDLPRLRSNSVPVAVSLMDCTAEEAGLIFSAAEKASARRRKAQSFDDTALSPPPEDSLASDAGTPLYEDADMAEDDVDAHTAAPRVPRESVNTPLPTLSQEATPTTSPGIKTYNVDMVNFIRQRLQDMAETYYSPPQQRTQPPPAEQEQRWSVMPQRPPLHSHFSNWSTISTPDVDADMTDLAASPPPIDEDFSDDDAGVVEDEDVEKGYAHIVQFRQRVDMERSSSPSYFSWPARQRAKPPAHNRITFDTPITAELRVPEQAKSSTPLIDLNASQPDVSRASRGAGFFDFGFRTGGELTPSPSPAAPPGFLPLHMGQHLPSPQPIRC